MIVKQTQKSSLGIGFKTLRVFKLSNPEYYIEILLESKVLDMIRRHFELFRYEYAELMQRQAMAIDDQRVFEDLYQVSLADEYIARLNRKIAIVEEQLFELCLQRLILLHGLAIHRLVLVLRCDLRVNEGQRQFLGEIGRLCHFL